MPIELATVNVAFMLNAVSGFMLMALAFESMGCTNWPSREECLFRCKTELLVSTTMPPASLPASVMPLDDPDPAPELPLPEDDDPLLDPLEEPPLELLVDPPDALPADDPEDPEDPEDPDDELLFCVDGDVVEQPTTKQRDAAIPSGAFLDLMASFAALRADALARAEFQGGSLRTFPREVKRQPASVRDLRRPSRRGQKKCGGH
jgi:hypothetical protein